MADNITINAMSGGPDVRTIQRTADSKHRQVVAFDGGGSSDASAEAIWTMGAATASASMPVVLASDQGAVPVTGAFWPTTQPVTGTFWQATQPVSGAVSVSNFPATQPVSGTFWQTTQPVSIAAMPSTPVTGAFWQSTQPVSIASMPPTPVTGTFWQTTQPVSIASLPSISGAVSVSNFPSTQAVSGTFWQTTQPVSLSALPALASGANVIGGVTQSGTWTTERAWSLTSGADSVTATISGTVPVSGTFWQATQPVSLASLPAISGSVSVSNFPATQPVSIASMPSTPVTGSFWQATQPVSIASMPPTPVTGTFWQTTQPVSGTFWQTTQPVSLASLPALPTGSNVIGGVTQSGTWTTARSWTLGSAGDSVSAVQSGAWSVSATISGNPVLGAGSAAIGTVGVTSLPQTTVTVSVTPTVTAGVYGVSYSVGGIMTFASILPASYAGVLQSIKVSFKGSKQTGVLYAAIFSASPSSGTYTNNGAVTWNAADDAALLGVYMLASPQSPFGTHAIYNLDGIGKALVGASTSLFVVLVTPAALVSLGSASDMTVQLGVMQG